MAIGKVALKHAGVGYVDDVYAIVPHRARGYQKTAGQVQNAGLMDSSYKLPGGGLVTTAEDLVSFAIAMTDDRGYYEFANLPPGNYKVMVNTKPWYATSAQPRRGDASSANAGNSQDPSLDVTYADTWYPGVDDPTQAETLALLVGPVLHDLAHVRRPGRKLRRPRRRTTGR